MKIKDRVKATTPPFFRKLRNTGLTLAALSASLLAAPVALPALLIKLAGYLAVAGTVAATVSQTVTKDAGETEKNPSEEKAHGQ